MTDKMDERYLKFFELFNERDFYECHEVLEDLWLETFDDQRGYFQGLIQTATAFFHLENGNLAGARKLFESGLEYLKPYDDRTLGFDLGGYREQCRRWLDIVRRKTAGEPIDIDSNDFPVLEAPG